MTTHLESQVRGFTIGLPRLVLLVLSGCRPDQPEADGAACADCEIRYERIATIGRPEDPWSIQSRIGVRIVKRQHGEYLVFEVGRPILARYSAQGDYLGTIGKVGSGPGEFRSIQATATDDADSLYVFDGRLQTMAVFSPALDHVRTVEFPHAVLWFVPVDSGFVVHGHEPDSVRGRHRLHLISRAGTYLRGYDSSGDYHGKRIGSGAASRAGQLRGTRLYVIEQVPARISVYDAETGQLERVTEVRPPWYPGPAVETKRYVPDSPELLPLDIPQRPARTLMDISALEDGKVVTLAWVESPGWEDVDPPFGGVPPTGAVQRHMERYWVGRIDVYDPLTLGLVGGLELPFFGRALVGEGELVTLSEREDGLIVLDVYQLALLNRATTAVEPSRNSVRRRMATR